jgi:hypothetical protein
MKPELLNDDPEGTFLMISEWIHKFRTVCWLAQALQKLCQMN